MKREEAIKIVKSHYPANKQMLNEALEFLIPELQENNDEKIRKALIERITEIDLEESVKGSGFYAGDYDGEEICDWLERQGDKDKLIKELGEYKVKYTQEVLSQQLEKQDKIDKASYEIGEKEKYDFVSGKFIECIKSFDVFKEDNSYWLEYVGNDNYIGRSDNILNQKFNITPKQLYSSFTQYNCPEESNTNEETNAPTAYGKYVDECLNEAAEHFFSEGEDKYSVADLFYAGVRCGKSWYENKKPVACNDIDSSDDKIRKGLIKGLSAMRDIHHRQTFSDDVININDAIDWLEKQGNNTPTIIWHNIDEKPEEMKELFCEWESDDATWHDIAFYDEESHTFRHAKMPINVTKWVYVDELLEKQGEQKPVIDFKAKNWYVSKVDGKIHNIYYSVDKVEPKFKVRYAGGEYNVLEVKDIAGVTFYGIEDEPNHIDYVKAENCEIISGYAIKENGSPYPTKSAVFSEKKPTVWSEEDDYNLQCMIAKVTSDIQKGNVGRNNELIEWLKSFKDRVQPQPKDWSDEDEVYKEFAISAVEDYYDEENPLQKELVGWLKSFKYRLNWKPNKEQMNALLGVMVESGFNYIDYNILESLYNDLKKL